jgi:hypothetical protein
MVTDFFGLHRGAVIQPYNRLMGRLPCVVNRDNGFPLAGNADRDYFGGLDLAFLDGLADYLTAACPVDLRV